MAEIETALIPMPRAFGADLDARPIWTALIKPQPDGTLIVAIPVDPDSDPDDDSAIWVVETFDCQRGRELAAALTEAWARGHPA